MYICTVATINPITLTLNFTIMIKILEGASDKAIAIEIIGGYETDDEKSIEKMFEEKISSGMNKGNLLIKIDRMSITHSSWKAMWSDGIYALKNIKHCGHIAVVGDSKVEGFLVKMDNALFGSEKAGRIEKYFNVSDLDKAMGWINE